MEGSFGFAGAVRTPVCSHALNRPSEPDRRPSRRPETGSTQGRCVLRPSRRMGPPSADETIEWELNDTRYFRSGQLTGYPHGWVSNRFALTSLREPGTRSRERES